MKRPLQGDGGSKSQEGPRKTKVRRCVDARSRDDGEVETGDLDLNATPRGFDLNAPVAEEEGSQEQTGWLGESPRPVQNEKEVEAASAQHPVTGESFEGTHLDVSRDDEPEPGQADDNPRNESVVECSNLNDEGNLDVHEDEDMKAESAPPSKPLAAIASLLARPLDPPSALGIDEDLDIISSAWAALQEENMMALDDVLADACEELAKSPYNPSKYHLLSCFYISKKYPESFRLPRTFQILLSFFNSGKGAHATKRQVLLPLLACKLLHRAFALEPEWPLEFVEHYLEDAAGVRAWIELEGCKDFVANVVTAFPDGNTDVAGSFEDTSRQDSQGAADSPHGISSLLMVATRNRYPREELRQQVRTKFLQALNQLLATNSTKENPRILLRLLMQGAGYEEVRVVGSSMLESWLNNPLHLRSAKSLLDQIVKYTHATSENDFNTVANLLALRVSSPQVSGQIKSLHGNIFAEMVTQLVRRRPEYATLALKTFVTAEINNKNSQNVKSIATVLKAMPECPPPEQELALIFQELAANDDSRLHLRDLIRRVMKHISSDINVHALCHGLMQPWPAMAEQHETLKQTWLKQIVDLVCQLLLHAVAVYATDEALVTAIVSSPTPPSGSASHLSGFGVSPLKEKLSLMEKFCIETVNLQEDALAWCNEVLAVYLPSIKEQDFLQTVRQLLFLEGPEAYGIRCDSTGDVDLLAYKLLTFCLHAPEEILATLILMGISNYPLSQVEAMSTIEGLVWRATKLQKYMNGALTVKSEQLPEAIYKLASVNLSAKTRLQFVWKDIYWRASLVILTIAVCNPTTIGQFVWMNCPTVRFLMEVLLTGQKSLSTLYGVGVDKSEADRIEMEAIQRDIKAEEAISAIFAVQTETVGPALLPSRVEELKGNVMLLEQGGPIRQPSIRLLEELDRIDEIYQLGHMLRKCRNPNFFSQVTGGQTLQKAWPWLGKISFSDPDVMTVLPCLWQCELLYMHERSPIAIDGQTLDLSEVRSNLHEILTQGTRINEEEVKMLVGLLAKKLASKNSLIRSCARRCFNKLFTRDVVSTTAEFAPKHTYMEGKSSEKLGSAFGATDSEDCGWLETAAGAATKQWLVGPLAPCLQLAIETESSIPVIVAYINFLHRHSASLPDSTSLACCVSLLVVRRRMLAKCLLLGSLRREHGRSSSEQSKYDSVVDIILRTVCTSMQVGSTSDFAWKNIPTNWSHLVILASPIVNGKDLAVQRVQVQKMVVDAAIELLALLASNGEDTGKQVEDLLQLLLPGFVCSNSETWSGTSLIAWLENPDGQKFPLLSETQAVAFGRSKDTRVVRAGLSVLSLEAKLDLLAEFALSLPAGRALLEEFDEVSETRLMVALCSKGITTQRAMTIWSAVNLLINSGSIAGSNFKEMLWRLTLPHVQSHAGVPVPNSISVEANGRTDAGCMEATPTGEKSETPGCDMQHLLAEAPDLFSGEVVACNTNHLPEYKTPSETCIACSKYLHLRKNIAKLLLRQNFEETSILVESLSRSISRSEKKGVWAASYMTLRLPVLTFLLRCGLCLVPPSMSADQEESHFLNLLSSLRNSVRCMPRDADGLGTSGRSGICNRVLFILEELEVKFFKIDPWRRTVSSFLLGRQCFQDEMSCGHSLSNILENVPIHRLETELLLYFGSSRFTGSASGTTDLFLKGWQDEIGQPTKCLVPNVMRDLVNLLRNWQDNSISLKMQSPAPLKLAQVELAGRCALVMELLLFIDPELQSGHHLHAILGAPCAQANFLFKDLEVPSHTFIALERMMHKSSWSTISRIIGALLCCQGDQAFDQKVVKENEKTEFVSKLFAESETLVEFICSCIGHPRAQLACRVTVESDHRDVRSFLITRFLNPSSVLVLVYLAVIESFAVMVSIKYSPPSRMRDLEHDSSFSRLTRALRLITLPACEGSKLMCTVVQKLVSLYEGKDIQTFATSKGLVAAKASFEAAIKEATGHLIWGLYSTFPVAVSASSPCAIGKLFQPTDLSLGPRYHVEQVSPLSHVLHHSVTLICTGNENDSNAAYGFLHEFARQHPALVVKHLPTVAFRLKDLLPSVKHAEGQARLTVARALSMGVELLDALRPFIFDLNKSDSADVDLGTPDEQGNIVPRNQLELILSLYFRFLQDLDVQDRPQFAKFVARLADFLCHCVAAGTRSKEFVMYHKPVLQTTAQNFGKIKKLGYLLTLLKNGSDSHDELTSQELQWKSSNTGPSTLSSFSVDDVLKVRTQLLQCLRWQTKAYDWKNTEFSMSRMELRDSPRHVHGLSMEEIEDLNLDAVLSDLEQASARMPTILPVLEDALLELSKVSDASIRDRAYNLLQRQLLHCPSKESSTKIMQGLLEQLTSTDVAFAKTAARHAAEFFYCCPEFQESILVEMLKGGRVAADDLQQLIQGLFTVAKGRTSEKLHQVCMAKVGYP